MNFTSEPVEINPYNAFGHLFGERSIFDGVSVHYEDVLDQQHAT